MLITYAGLAWLLNTKAIPQSVCTEYNFYQHITYVFFR
jgi:hypothetical protein